VPAGWGTFRSSDHAATIVPDGVTAIRTPAGKVFPGEVPGNVSGALQTPPTGRTAIRTLSVIHRAIALPAASMPRVGVRCTPETVSGALQAPPAGRSAARRLPSAFARSPQPATAFPAGSTATLTGPASSCGSAGKASVLGAPHAPAGVRAAAWTPR
jgi:hypothetical protein